MRLTGSFWHSRLTLTWVACLTAMQPITVPAQNSPAPTSANKYSAQDEAFDRNAKNHEMARESPPVLSKSPILIVELMSNEGLQAAPLEADPGYPLVICPAPATSAGEAGIVLLGRPEGAPSQFQERLTSVASSIGRALICANSSFGREIINIRRWYCGEVPDCVQVEWVGGRPKWGQQFGGPFAAFTFNGLTITRYKDNPTQATQ